MGPIYNKTNKKVVVLISISSDIGHALAKKYSELGYKIVGTYRSETLLEEIKKIPDCHLFYCDIENKKDISRFIYEFKDLGLKWDIFISCVGTQKPIGAFFNCDFDEWTKSMHINSIEPLRILHDIYPYKNQNSICNVVFFAGGGSANKATKNYSAYALSKIMLTKMCELLDFENKDLKFFIIGPGWTKTKMHYETLNEKKEKVGENYEKTLEFMKQDGGTSMEDIFNCIEWLCKQDKEVVGGRNFSVVYDKWKENSKKLSELLRLNKDMYKLRRCGNDLC